MSEGSQGFQGFVAEHPALERSALEKLLDRHFDRESIAIGRRVEWTDVVRFPSGAPLLTDWPQGQVFSAKLEVRWREIMPQPEEAGEPVYAVLALTEIRSLLDGDKGLLAAGFVEVGNPWQAEAYDEALHVYLWGERAIGRPHWVETRVPRPLTYPLPPEAGPGRARVGHVRYSRSDGGATQYIRLCGLQVDPGRER